ncbi:hypothetical protein FGG08_006122 [Glutinoglossum americanum]|uniref:Uncharacterized protein n=1 Tax=Glutinoglossum americanum TaxID=1670608 RepID=A0A9P8KVA9_9PEZI|nr:hypothetical protein FGG08_006122 [Glutinoglossum americanum]
MPLNGDSLPPLYPIVIPPLTYSSTSNGKAYTCSGEGLIWDGHKFDPNIKGYLPLLEPVRTKKGTIAIRQPRIPEKLAAWWKAQCKFRGLSQQGTIRVLQERIRAADNGMAEELAVAEKELNEEFRKKNAAARDDKWNSMGTDKEKAEADPGRFLKEKFITGTSRSAAVIIETNYRRELHEEAAPLGLHTQSTDAPLRDDGTLPSINRWIVIGRDRASVHKKILEVSREATRIRQRVQEAREERTRKKHQAIVQKAKKTSAAPPSKGSKGRDMKWNVAGSYDIKCPYIEESWGRDGKECSLNIYIERESSGAWQMWAEFGFIALEGIFRFVNPSRGGADAPPARTDNNKDGEDDEDEEGCEYDESDEDDDIDPLEFLIPATHHPSSTTRTWLFRWRGAETGEGEIQLYSDQQLCSLTFRGAYGTEIEGKFESDLTGEIGFTGMKVEEEEAGVEAVEYRWGEFSESAYEYARKARWGGGW